MTTEKEKIDVLDELIIEKAFKCDWCDVFFAYRKDDKIKMNKGFKKSNAIFNKRVFCCKKHEEYYMKLLERFDNIERRLSKLEEQPTGELAK